MDKNLIEQFSLFGRELFLAGMNNSHSGNMSFFEHGKGIITITKTGAMLGVITESSLVETTAGENCELDKIASREIVVHRAIYNQTSKKAIIHAHPPAVIAMSFENDVIRPIDAEGGYYFCDGVPVITVKNAIASSEVAVKIAPYLEKYNIAVVRGHGTFAAAESLEKCLLYTTSLEFACRCIINHKIIAGK